MSLYSSNLSPPSRLTGLGDVAVLVYVEEAKEAGGVGHAALQFLEDFPKRRVVHGLRAEREGGCSNREGVRLGLCDVVVTRWEEGGHESHAYTCAVGLLPAQRIQSVGAADRHTEPPPGKGSGHGECVWCTCGGWRTVRGDTAAAVSGYNTQVPGGNQGSTIDATGYCARCGGVRLGGACR